MPLWTLHPEYKEIRDTKASAYRRTRRRRRPLTLTLRAESREFPDPAHASMDGALQHCPLVVPTAHYTRSDTCELGWRTRRDHRARPPAEGTRRPAAGTRRPAAGTNQHFSLMTNLILSPTQDFMHPGNRRHLPGAGHMVLGRSAVRSPVSQCELNSDLPT
ncbi:hypothetical protein EYF80_052166 [Liparis tanakae]|uniref:Uncharacterized protein n=1 Tax=Liparis tanakae TaxID=230148 RepID=A0A4Z2FA44_9TELE|nr:hypothetical protein EYF80_052166 [Liparis tanakae]